MNSEFTSECQVCGKRVNGKRHYGAVVCRACAAFFRRTNTFKDVKECKWNQKCDFFKNGVFTCKYCRLQKCLAVGMSAEKFQLEWDSYRSKIEISKKIPTTMDQFIGKSNLIIFCAQDPSSSQVPKNYIDLRSLLDKAQKILFQGPETPIQSKTRLGKLAMRLQPILDYSNPVISTSEVYGQEEALALLENDILTVTKWLTYFDEFQKLPRDLKIKILEAMWSKWAKLTRIANTAKCIRQNNDESELRKMKIGHLLYSSDQAIDMSWLSTYSIEELKFFIDIKTECRLDELTRAMIELEPSDIELSFMLGQLCFHHVGKRFQGEILQVADKFQQILADDLHFHYTTEMRQSNYVKRLTSMMKINNMIQNEIIKHKEKTELALVFNIFNVDVSHPGMFVELAS